MAILFIDDNKSLTKALSKFLSAKGYEHTVSNSGREGLKLIQEQKFDKVLLDLSMPEFSGYDVIDSLEKSGKIKELKIIVLTAASVHNAEITELKRRGVVCFLKKPVKLDELVKQLEA